MIASLRIGANLHTRQVRLGDDGEVAVALPLEQCVVEKTPEALDTPSRELTETERDRRGGDTHRIEMVCQQLEVYIDTSGVARDGNHDLDGNISRFPNADAIRPFRQAVELRRSRRVRTRQPMRVERDHLGAVDRPSDAQLGDVHLERAALRSSNPREPNAERQLDQQHADQ